MAEVALLAPIQLDHLNSGLETQAMHGRVQFGTREVKALEKFAGLLNGLPADVFIYAAGAGVQGRVTWQAKFLGVSSKEVPKYRPHSTRTDTQSLLYYDICDLRPLPETAWMSITRFSGYGKLKHYASNYDPRRPTLVNPISN